VWVLKDGQPQALTVTTGIADGRHTEVVAGELQPGMLVITDQRGGATP
jgi:HlyD family secretion protein